jgi:hypothetical protein
MLSDVGISSEIQGIAFSLSMYSACVINFAIIDYFVRSKLTSRPVRCAK